MNIAFERTARRGFYSVTLNGKRSYVPFRLFYAVFPRMNRQVTRGTVEATDRQLEALGIVAEIMEKDRHQIRYTVELGYDIYGRPCATNYIVNAFHLGQTIAIVPAAFRRITGAHERATDGCMDVTGAQLGELGFIRKEVVSNAASNAILSA
ncbi:hypothetical protein PVOR_01975 [Paenibacillus vortex V453]|uniref:Uncharacterized protein n=1 Tax=Paenibacillus vortex V453 TaxID=715225 RepID=A0A2R9T2X7_9BACL|nr:MULTISPECIES: hypothetical protein [Paenibacillus]EFU43934.1 hypothetical protein PVOR_01975 [Paenibacillus vortex V453]MDH6673643.1 hypothetical protein [Paenibacillus sp. LBL]